MTKRIAIDAVQWTGVNEGQIIEAFPDCLFVWAGDRVYIKPKDLRPPVALGRGDWLVQHDDAVLALTDAEFRAGYVLKEGT